MSVLEIAKIQVRRGDARETGLPQLDTGEFGWAIRGTGVNSSQPELYIGNRTVDGADRDQNVRILTEYDNIFGLDTSAASYSYVGHSSAPIFTDPSGISQFSRSLQSKLDDIVTIYDFGGVTDGSVSSTLVLQNAINQLFLNSDRNVLTSRVALRLPPGIYNIDDTVLLPPYATILGAGKDRTVINIVTQGIPAFQTCDSSKRILGEIYDAERPTNIVLDGITFKYDQSLEFVNSSSLVNFDCATDSVITNCKFVGAFDPFSLQLLQGGPGYSGLSLRGQGALTTEDILVYNCTFQNLFYGIESNYDIVDSSIARCIFKHLNRGIVHGESLAVGNSTGPLRTSFRYNKFYNIQREGVYIGQPESNTNHSVMFNSFTAVGLSGTSEISLLSKGNSAIHNRVSQRLVGTSAIPVITGHSYATGFVVNSTAVQSSLTPVELFNSAFTGPDTIIKVEYSLVKPEALITRKGVLTINVSSVLGNTDATISDSYSYTGVNDGGVEFSVVFDAATNNVSVRYQSVDAIGTITYKISQLQ